jgi:type I restriction enzyme S subunit
MSLEWQVFTLGEVTDWASGGTPKKDVLDYWNGDIPWISASSMHGTRFSDSDLKITQSGLKNGSRLATKDSILLLVRGSALHNKIPVGIATRDVAFNQDVKAIVPKKEQVSPWYLLFWLMGNEQFLLNSVVEFTGIGAGKLDTKRMQALEIVLPSRKKQDLIVEIIKALDDRITLLRETNATLEAIAQALFKSWFVDFDPVHAKAQGRQPEGMDEQTAALFPDRFVKSELGMVPLGWEVGTLGNVSTVKGGFAYKGESFCDKGFPVIKIKNIVGDGTVNLIDVQYVSSEIAEKTKRFALQDGDIVIAMTGATIGKTGIIVTNEFIPYLNQRVAKFEENSKGQNNKWFVFVAFQNLFISDQIVNSASGSAQPNISTTGIESVRLVIPKDTKLLSVYNELVSPLFNSWISNHKQTQTLATLRDTLLPRLISGQLRLPDVEA